MCHTEPQKRAIQSARGGVSLEVVTVVGDGICGDVGGSGVGVDGVDGCIIASHYVRALAALPAAAALTAASAAPLSFACRCGLSFLLFCNRSVGLLKSPFDQMLRFFGLHLIGPLKRTSNLSCSIRRTNFD